MVAEFVEHMAHEPATDGREERYEHVDVGVRTHREVQRRDPHSEDIDSHLNAGEHFGDDVLHLTGELIIERGDDAVLPRADHRVEPRCVRDRGLEPAFPGREILRKAAEQLVGLFDHRRDDDRHQHDENSETAEHGRGKGKAPRHAQTLVQRGRKGVEVQRQQDAHKEEHQDTGHRPHEPDEQDREYYRREDRRDRNAPSGGVGQLFFLLGGSSSMSATTSAPAPSCLAVGDEPAGSIPIFCLSASSC